MIVDGHCQVRDPHYLRRLVEAFEAIRRRYASAGRSRCEPTSRPRLQRAVAAARASWLGHNPDSAIYSDVARFVAADNVAVAYRREVFDRVGLFDESFDACEDVEFNTRVRQAGLTCYFTPAIAVEYQPRGTLRGLAYQMTRYGRGRARLGLKHPAMITAASLVPPLWLRVARCGGRRELDLDPVRDRLRRFASRVSVGCSGGIVAGVARRSRHFHFVRLPLVFATIHAGFGWGYLRETVTSLHTLTARLVRWLVARPTASTIRD